MSKSCYHTTENTGTPVIKLPIFIIKRVMPPTKARFATNHDRINDAYLLMMGNFPLNGKLRATPTTNFRYRKNQGIVIIARAGRHGPPKKISIADFASKNFGQFPGDKGDDPASMHIFDHDAANTIPDKTLATKLYASTMIAPRYTATVNASVLSRSPIFLVQ